MKTAFSWFAAAGLALLAGCSNVTVRTLPNTNLAQFKRVFVLHRLADGRDLDKVIAADLQAMGLEASSGAATMMPRDTELVVSYVDDWAWDFNNYMIGLDLQVKNARTDRTLATGHVYRPSQVFSTSPDAMIHDLVAQVFKRP